MSISQTSKEIETIEPQTLDAPAEDVQLASKAAPVDEKIPAPAPEPELASFSNSIQTSLKLPGLDVNTSATTNFAVDPPVELISPVKQWRPDWVQYDEYYRPIILNPYRDPVRIVYMYEMTPRIMIVPPLGRMVFEAAQYAAYSFTARPAGTGHRGCQRRSSRVQHRGGQLLRRWLLPRCRDASSAAPAAGDALRQRAGVR